MATQRLSRRRRVPNVLASVRRGVDLVRELGAEAGMDEDDLFRADLCLTEALTNSIVHGGKDAQAPQTEIVCEVAGNWLRCRISDSGEPFDPASAEPPPLPTTLVQLHHADRRLERHRVEAARRTWRRLGLNARLLEQHLQVLFALGQEVRLVREEEFWDGHLEHVGRQLQIDEHVVEVDEIDLLESDELLLHFKQATHDTLESLAHVHALLRVHGLVVALLELAENLQVADVKRCVLLKLLRLVSGGDGLLGLVS